MQQITGYAPTTCPWRAMYAPIVREVLDAMEHEETGNLAVAVGSDPPAVLIEAIGVYKRARDAVRAEDAKIAAEKRKQAR